MGNQPEYETETESQQRERHHRETVDVLRELIDAIEYLRIDVNKIADR